MTHTPLLPPFGALTFPLAGPVRPWQPEYDAQCLAELVRVLRERPTLNHEELRQVTGIPRARIALLLRKAKVTRGKMKYLARGFPQALFQEAPAPVIVPAEPYRIASLDTSVLGGIVQGDGRRTRFLTLLVLCDMLTYYTWAEVTFAEAALELPLFLQRSASPAQGHRAFDVYVSDLRGENDAARLWAEGAGKSWAYVSMRGAWTTHHAERLVGRIRDGLLKRGNRREESLEWWRATLEQVVRDINAGPERDPSRSAACLQSRPSSEWNAELVEQLLRARQHRIRSATQSPIKSLEPYFDDRRLPGATLSRPWAYLVHRDRSARAAAIQRYARKLGNGFHWTYRRV